MSEEYEIEVIPVVVAEEPIELYKILKIENLVTSGSEAKNYIADGYVYVNGEVETRKRKKIMFGDIIGFDGEAYQVMSAEELAEYGFAEESDEAHDAESADYAIDAGDIIDPALAPAPIAAPVMDTVVEARPTDMWEQPAKQHKKAESKSKANAKKSKPAEPKSSNKKKGRAAPFSF